MSKGKFGTIFIDSTSWPYNDDDDEWLDSPPMCGDVSHERGVLVMFVFNGYFRKYVMSVCKFTDLHPQYLQRAPLKDHTGFITNDM